MKQSESRAYERLVAHQKQRGAVDPGSNTRHEIALLASPNCIGLEVGVDTGQLSERFLQLEHFSSFHSVDKWDDHAHSEEQYWAVTEKLMPYEKSRVWRMTAQRFATLVPDDMFGFIYIDCYAHTGQNDGEVLEVLWPKLRKGGIFSGDDYDLKSWPKTYDSVRKFCERTTGKPPNVIDEFIHDAKLPMDRHPSWWVRK
jgi:hypothetical protein